MFLPGDDFFEAVLLLAAAGNRICRKMLFFLGFVVLELARPSQPCFRPREVIFSKLFYF